MIIRPGDELADLFGGDRCFQCGNPVWPPFVHWHGDDAEGAA